MLILYINMFILWSEYKKQHHVLLCESKYYIYILWYKSITIRLQIIKYNLFNLQYFSGNYLKNQ